MLLKDEVYGKLQQFSKGLYRSYYVSDNLAAHFSSQGWRLIFPMYKNDEELMKKVNECPYTMAVFICQTQPQDTSFGFVTLFVTDLKHKIVSFHGGGWGHPLQHYRAARVIVQALLLLGYNVRTTVRECNIRACRFVKGLGFIPYRHIDGYVYYRLNKKCWQLDNPSIPSRQ